MIELQLRFTEDLPDIVYSGYGCMASAVEAAEPMFRQEMAVYNTVLKMRHDFSVSGAMRWPWSQEAPIVTRRKVSDAPQRDEEQG